MRLPVLQAFCRVPNGLLSVMTALGEKGSTRIQGALFIDITSPLGLPESHWFNLYFYHYCPLFFSSALHDRFDRIVILPFETTFSTCLAHVLLGLIMFP